VSVAQDLSPEGRADPPGRVRAREALIDAYEALRAGDRELALVHMLAAIEGQLEELWAAYRGRP